MENQDKNLITISRKSTKSVKKLNKNGQKLKKFARIDHNAKTININE